MSPRRYLHTSVLVRHDGAEQGGLDHAPELHVGGDGVQHAGARRVDKRGRRVLGDRAVVPRLRARDRVPGDAAARRGGGHHGALLAPCHAAVRRAVQDHGGDTRPAHLRGARAEHRATRPPWIHREPGSLAVDLLTQTLRNPNCKHPPNPFFLSHSL